MNNIKHLDTECTQGHVGFSNYLGKNLFWKFPQYLNHCVFHEYSISLALQDLHEMCPHFTQYFGLSHISLPAKLKSRHFESIISKTELQSTDPLFDRSIVFTEKIKNFSLRKYICDFKLPFKMIFVQIILSLLAVYIAQSTHDFVHYDLHYSNVLLQNCDKQTLFLYVFKDQTILMPTFGYYPVLIDYGYSYTREQKVPASLYHYEKGIQPSFADRLQDIHYLLFPVFHCVNVQSDEQYDSISYLFEKVRKVFRRVPVLSEDSSQCGNKILFNDLFDTWIDIIESYTVDAHCTFLKKWKNKDQLFAILTPFIRIPFKPHDFSQDYLTSESFKLDIGSHIDNIIEGMSFLLDKSFQKSVENEFENKDRHKHPKLSDNLILSKYKALLELYNINVKSDPQYEVKNKKRKMVNAIGLRHLDKLNVTNWDYRKLNAIFALNVGDYIKILQTIVNNIDKLLTKLEALYFLLELEHREILETCYNKTSVQNGLDMAIFFLKTFTPCFEVCKTDDVYIWDTMAKTRKRCLLKNFDDVQIENINKLPILKKGKKLYELLN